MVVNKQTAVDYPWGAGCEGWILQQAADLMVIQERMPPNSTERRHYHSKARQFFYVLSGELTMEVEGIVSRAPSQSGIEIPPLARHQARNRVSTPTFTFSSFRVRQREAIGRTRIDAKTRDNRKGGLLLLTIREGWPGSTMRYFAGRLRTSREPHSGAYAATRHRRRRSNRRAPSRAIFDPARSSELLRRIPTPSRRGPRRIRSP